LIQKNSIIRPVDNCGVLKANVFHLYKGSNGRLAFVGDFLKISCREVVPENTIKKKSKHRSILIRTKFSILKKDGSFVKFNRNSLILLKKRLTPRGANIRGPISRKINRKKFISSFSRSI
jgi:large subunit ribosomal protein L14